LVIFDIEIIVALVLLTVIWLLLEVILLVFIIVLGGPLDVVLYYLLHAHVLLTLTELLLYLAV
jgi:hypothetical protein